jgi:hypothetical protein
MDGAEILIPILVPLAGCALIFGIVYLKSRENMAMIEKGMNPKDKMNRPAPFRSLKTGLLFLGAGVGLFLAYMLEVFVIIRSRAFNHFDNIEALYFSLIGIGGGLGLVISYLIEKKHWLDKNNGE